MDFNRRDLMLIEQMEELIEKLNYYTDLYESGKPEISDTLWDNMYFTLVKLEAETGFAFKESPTQRIRYEIVNELKTVEHNHPMLSLNKTKDYDEIKKFVGDKTSVAMAKMDGLSCSILYENGKLVRAETRGKDGIGEDITHNIITLPSVPKKINYTETLVVDGEIICDKETFKEFADKYKNPRNFAAGSIRLLDSKECANRKLKFVAWDLIKGYETVKSFYHRLWHLKELGFTIVPFHWFVSLDYFPMDELITAIEELNYPIDGLVFRYNDLREYAAAGATEHHPKGAMAFKFEDETETTSLIRLDWTMGRTGVLTPVAVFDPIELEGTEVERANLHNLSVMKDILGTPYIGQTLEIYKANQIIPQVSSAGIPECKADILGLELKPPKYCPICGEVLMVDESETGVLNLMCINPKCEGKLINKLDHFAGKKGLDIKGLSVATLEKLIDWGWIDTAADIFELKKYRSSWIKKPGFGEKSVDNILNAIENSKETTLESFISAIGIPLIGRAMAKELNKYFSTYEEFRTAILEGVDFTELDGFAEVKSSSICEFDYTEADLIFEKYLRIKKLQNVKEDKGSNCKDLKIVITGTLQNYKNRDEMKKEIEDRGGKVVGSISKNVNILINNDINSGSSKNTKAKELGIPIMSEEEFVSKYF